CTYLYVIYSLLFVSFIRQLLRSTLFPYTTLFRSRPPQRASGRCRRCGGFSRGLPRRFPPQFLWRRPRRAVQPLPTPGETFRTPRSEEHTSELQSRENLVCRLLLEKKKTVKTRNYT